MRGVEAFGHELTVADDVALNAVVPQQIDERGKFFGVVWFEGGINKGAKMPGALVEFFAGVWFDASIGRVLFKEHDQGVHEEIHNSPNGYYKPNRL